MSSAAMQGLGREGDMHDASKMPNAALHASFEAARALVAADASYTGQFALAALRVLQHGCSGMHTCSFCATSSFFSTAAPSSCREVLYGCALANFF